MTGLDTNLVVRVLTRDDPEQTDRAISVFARDRLWLPKTVLLECEGVLRSAYSLSRRAILDAFRRLLGYRPLEVEDRAAVLQALHWYEAGLDFADALHLASLESGARLASFDRELARRAGGIEGTPPVDLV